MSKKKHIRRKILFIFTVVIFILFASKTYEQYSEYKQLNNKKTELTNLIEEEKNIQMDLLMQKEYFKTEEYIEEKAREKYRLIKEGEKLFIIE